MRKVYHSKGSHSGLAAALVAGVGLTGTIFCILPFSHLVNKPSKTVELRRTGAVDLPPPAEELVPPPPTENEPPPQAPPTPQLAEAPQQLSISPDLELAAGAGGALAGFGEARALTGAQAVQDQAFDVSELEKRPEAISQVAPAYPAELRKAKIDGSVMLMFVLDENGRVEDPRVENSSRPEFEKPAVEAIKKWRFRPGIREGKAVRTYIRIPIKFKVTTG